MADAKTLKDAEWQEQKAAMEAKKRQDEIDAAILAKKLAEERLQQDLAERERKEKEVEKKRFQESVAGHRDRTYHTKVQILT